jgi:hypothetical protein
MHEKDTNLSKKFMDQITPKTPFKKNKINELKKLLLSPVARAGVGKSTIA